MTFSYTEEKEEVERAVKNSNEFSTDFDDEIFELSNLQAFVDALDLSLEDLGADWKLDDGKLVTRPT